MAQLTAQEVKKAILKWPGRYQTPKGMNFKGMLVSKIPTQLRDCGWRNVSQLSDRHTLERLGLKVTRARYVGGARPKEFCDVVVAKIGDC